MRIPVPISKKRYLYELRQQLGSFTALWSERFTGVVFGNFIYITHHAGFEFNRRITNEKSRAIGFVTKQENGCAVNVICTRGYLDPWWMGIFYMLFLFSLLLKDGNSLGSDAFWLAGVCSVLFGLLSYIQCWFTERGRQGMWELCSLLQDPCRFWVTEEEQE